MATSAEARQASRLARRRQASREGRNQLTPYLYLTPAPVVYAAFLLWPLLRAAQYSLFAWDTVSPARFVGFQNYVDMVSDPELLASFGHSAILIFFYAVLPICFGLVVAAILNRAQVRGLGFFRTVIFLPQVIAMVVVAVAWTRIYSTDVAINELLRLFGLWEYATAWLAH